MKGNFGARSDFSKDQKIVADPLVDKNHHSGSGGNSIATSPCNLHARVNEDDVHTASAHDDGQVDHV